jgi:hypothetical protein
LFFGAIPPTPFVKNFIGVDPGQCGGWKKDLSVFFLPVSISEF